MQVARCVVDASVAIKWYIPEERSDVAFALLQSGIEMHAPDLLFAEIGSILWKKQRRGDVTTEQAEQVIRDLEEVELTIHPTRSLLGPALELAIIAGRTVYDSLYLALAIELDCQTVTADERLVNSLTYSSLGPYVRLVGKGG